MKKFICFLLAIILVFALIGCGAGEAGDHGVPSKRFILVETVKGAGYYKENVFCDAETGVLYLGIRDPMGNLGVTVLVDRDGKPLTCDDYPNHVHPAS